MNKVSKCQALDQSGRKCMFDNGLMKAGETLFHTCKEDVRCRHGSLFPHVGTLCSKVMEHFVPR